MVLLRFFLVIVAIVAGLKLIASLAIGMLQLSSLGQAVAGLIVLPLVLVAATIWLERSRRRRRTTFGLALGMFWLSALALLAAVFQLITSAGSEAFAMDVLLNVAAAAFCASGLAWGAACAANILERPRR